MDITNFSAIGNVFHFFDNVLSIDLEKPTRRVKGRFLHNVPL